MKSKYSKILGVGLTVVVLASMLVISTPASAGTLAFSSEASGATLPIKTGSDVVDVAAAGNGSTVYAALGAFDYSALSTDPVGAQALLKSTNGGASWTAINTNPASGNTTSVTKVAVAPDLADGGFVAIVEADTVAGTVVKISSDGGVTWAAAPALPGGVPLDVVVSSPIGTTRSLGVVSSDGNVYVLDLGGTFGGTWGTAITAGTNFGGGTALAVAFSPNFPGDRTIGVVTTNASNTVIQLYNKTSAAWNGTVYAGWGTGVSVAATTATAATLALAPTFLGADAASRVAYVGSAAGLYRIVDTASTKLTDAYQINSIALSKAGDVLVAGAINSSAVITVASPATATSASVVPSTKRPAGPASNMLVVGFAGSNVVVGSSGADSAFSQSTDNGKTFVDISLVDTTFTPTDFSVAPDGSVFYIASISGGTLSVFAKKTASQRVMAVASTAGGAIVRTAPDNASIAYVAEVGGSNQIYYTNDGGMTTWLPRYSPNLLTDMAVESASVVYILSGGAVSKSIDSGFIWDNPKTTLPSGVTGATLTLVSAGNLIVGDTAGGVSYSTNNNTSWTKVAANIAAGGTVLATADKLASGGNIYATSKSAGTNIYRWTVGTSTSWTSMLGTAATGGAAGIGLSGGTLYVVTYDSATPDSAFYRTLTPATATTDGSWSKIDPATEVTSTGTTYNLTFNNGPQNLDVSVGSDKNPKVWSLSISSGTAPANRTALESFTDILTTASPAQTAPADKFLDLINTATGYANNMVFQWNAITGTDPATATYTLQIALDSAFSQVVFTLGTSTAPFSKTLAIVGQNGNDGAYPFQSDTTYYWRVKVAGPVSSVYSAARSFKIDTLKPLSIVSPASGAGNVPVNPTFVWTPVVGATTYEVIVSDDPTFKIITFSRTTDKPEFASDEQLAYGTNYYWRVRASAPASAVTPYVDGIFTTVGKPAPTTTAPPPVTITSVPPPTVTVNLPPPVEAIPSYLLWIIIGIGAILVIALIVLVVRTRRTS